MIIYRIFCSKTVGPKIYGLKKLGQNESCIEIYLKK